MSFNKKLIKKLQNNIPVTILSNFEFNIPDNCLVVISGFEAMYSIASFCLIKLLVTNSFPKLKNPFILTIISFKSIF